MKLIRAEYLTPITIALEATEQSEAITVAARTCIKFKLPFPWDELPNIGHEIALGSGPGWGFRVRKVVWPIGAPQPPSRPEPFLELCERRDEVEESHIVMSLQAVANLAASHGRGRVDPHAFMPGGSVVDEQLEAWLRREPVSSPNFWPPVR